MIYGFITFHYVSILNVFSKIYEQILKNQLVSYLDETLSLFVAAYRKLYGTQHVVIRVAEEWKIKLDIEELSLWIREKLLIVFHMI